MARMKPLRLLLLPLLLAACVAKAPLPPPIPPATGEAWYQQASSAGQKIYPVNTAQSLITVTVRRGGALARMGHDHVIASRSIAGFVAPDAGRADFHFRLDQMTVDETALRKEAGLDTQPSAEAIEGTRDNMLNRVLKAEHYPVVMLHAERIAGKEGMLRLTITLHGVERTIDVPVLIEQTEASMTASGQVRLLQTDFGITPMSVMGGAMVVQDAMELQFTIVAGR
jgi:hypothetical protein